MLAPVRRRWFARRQASEAPNSDLSAEYDADNDAFGSDPEQVRKLVVTGTANAYAEYEYDNVGNMTKRVHKAGGASPGAVDKV